MASVSDTMTAINGALRTAGGAYADYSCKTVSWDDVERGTVGGGLSCWGANITDTRLWEKSGTQLYTVRSDNWNEKLGKVSADEVALVSGSQHGDGTPLKPVTLRDFLRRIGTEGRYAGLEPATDLSDPKMDSAVSIRFQTTFLPVADEQLAAVEFAPEMYNYQTRSDNDPRNLLILATTQGVAVQQDGAGAKKLFHHAVDPAAPQQVCRYWFEAERSRHAVGGAQAETREEAQEAAARGKATAAVIGTRAMGTRFNALLTVQVPLEQKPRPAPRGMMGGGAMMMMGGGGMMGGDMVQMLGGGGMGGGLKKSKAAKGMALGCAPKSAQLDTEQAMFAQEALSYAAPPLDSMKAVNKSLAKQLKSVSIEQVDDMEEEMADVLEYAELESLGGLADMVGASFQSCSAEWDEPPVYGSLSGSRRRCSRSRSAAPKRGTANAARVSRGSMHDRWAGLGVRAPRRDRRQHVTVTVVLYNTVAGGVPSAEDVRAAIDDMESLYAACGWEGRLAEQGAGFMKKELTVADAQAIGAKLATQPYMPPAGAAGLVVGGDAFPTSSPAA